ncbi:MAG: hypothetical protein IJ991_08480, partial [Thermoguttaceae bacterium]|nr:hypothetical protein [Thermoguttaceae bacterium]
PLMKMLADAGQKVITATLNRDPWRYQCFDDYEPMIYCLLSAFRRRGRVFYRKAPGRRPADSAKRDV